MELKEKMLASFMAFEQKIQDNESLHEVRNQAIKNFENKGFPSKKEEAWKYTSLNAILKNDFSVGKFINCQHTYLLCKVFIYQLAKCLALLKLT